MIPLLAIGSVLSAGGLRLDVPSDAAPNLYGLDFEVRYQALSDITVGLALAWSGGVNDTNEDRKLIAHRSEAQATAGYRLGNDDYAVHTRIRVGLMYVWGWPRGALSRLNTFAPAGGFELTGEIALSDTPGALWLEPHLGYEHVRLNQNGVHIPYVGLRLGGTLGQLYDD